MAIIKNPNTLIGVGGTNDYEDLENKPQINSTELSGNKTPEQLGLQRPTHSLSAVSTVGDSNEIPVYDGSGNKKVLFSTIKNALKNFFGIGVQTSGTATLYSNTLYYKPMEDTDVAVRVFGRADGFDIYFNNGGTESTVQVGFDENGKLTLEGDPVATAPMVENKENKPTYEEVSIEESDWAELDESVGAYTHYCEYEASEVPEEEHETSIVNDGSDCFLVNGIVIREINDEFITFYSVGVPEDASFKVAYREV